MAAGIAGVAFAPSLAWLYAVGPVIAVGNGLAFPSFTSLYSKACRAEEAGELLGESQSMATAGRIVGPLAAGALMREVGLEAPFLASGALLLGVAIGLGALRSRLLDRPGPPGS
jgi:MFS family permease